MKNNTLEGIHFLILLYDIAGKLGIDTDNPAWWDKSKEKQIEQVFETINLLVKPTATPSISEKVKTAIARTLHISVEAVNECHRIIDDLGADSLDIVEIATAIEGLINVQIDDAQMETLHTVQDIIDYAEKNHG